MTCRPKDAHNCKYVLIVSSYFPPATVAGVHRARHLAKYLPAHGWRPVVVRARPDLYEELADPELAALLPGDLEQVFHKALPARITRLAGVGDLGLRGLFHLAAAIDRAIGRYRPRVVMITGSPFYPLLLARRIKARHAVRVVLDLQDPWVSESRLPARIFSKAWLSGKLASRLEPAALRHADFVTSVSEVQNGQMRARHAFLDASRMAAIPIGGDTDDFAARPAPAGTSVGALVDPSFINFSYVGTILPRSGPVIACLMQAIGLLRQHSPEIAGRIRFNFVGTSNQARAGAPAVLQEYIAAAGLQDVVREFPQRVPFLQAVDIMRASDGLLLLGSDEPHYTASKIYPALMSGRPYVSVFHAKSGAHQTLLKAGGGRQFCFRDALELKTCAGQIAGALIMLATRPERAGSVDSRAYDAYTADAVAGQFAAIFDGLCATDGADLKDERVHGRAA